jgi:TolA-binding protein
MKTLCAPRVEIGFFALVLSIWRRLQRWKVLRNAFVRSRRVVLASFAVAALGVVLKVDSAFSLTSQDLPAADLPTNNPTPGIASAPSPGPVPSPAAPEALPTEVDITPEPSPAAAAPNDSSENSPGNDAGAADLQTDEETKTSESEPAALPSPPPPALDAGAVTLGPELGDKTLDPEINKAVAPTLAASLRLTESARKRLGVGHFDDAMRDLARAVSLDPSDAFAYYYLGRAYLTKGNYTQALTFFRRAEIGFNGRPEWTAEALSYEGICDEELGKPTDAAQAYKRALAASPNNFRARIGYGRLASITGPEANVDAAPPDQDLAIPPPSAPDESVPPEQPPPPPPE